MKKILLIFGFIFLLGGFFYYRNQSKKAKEVHYHAGFQVYIEGKLQDFSGIKYMSTVLCEEQDDQAKKSREQIQIEKAHLHGNVGDVVHVEIEGAVWGDLFKNINIELDKKKPEGYVNGEKVEDVLTYVIKPYDSVVIFVGKRDKGLLRKAVTKERIKKVEKEQVEC